MTAPDIAAAAAALVEQTCAAQGLPEHIEDPSILAKVAALVGPIRDGGAHRRGASEHITNTITTTATVAKRGGRPHDIR